MEQIKKQHLNLKKENEKLKKEIEQLKLELKVANDKYEHLAKFVGGIL